MKLAEFKRRLKGVDRVRVHIPINPYPAPSTYLVIKKRDAIELVLSTIGSAPRMRVKFPKNPWEALWLNCEDGEEVTP